jgi:hypothetical protein
MEIRVGNMAMIFRALPTLKLNSCKKANSPFDLRELAFTGSLGTACSYGDDGGRAENAVYL